MPITVRSRRGDNERLYQLLMDWVRRIMQLAVVAVALLYAYILYGLLFGSVSQWTTLSPADQARIGGNVQAATLYLNIAIGILLLTASVLYYDEQPTGYLMVMGAVLFYLGLPYLIGQLMPEQIQEWARSRNTAALAILAQFKTAGWMMALPGAVLLIRDVALQIIEGGTRKREQFSAMQYGGSVKEEAPVPGALIGVLAKCWQLPYCREAIRKFCPIYLARRRCWRERVGCMCEERVIRHAMDVLINKEEIVRDTSKPKAPGEDLVQGLDLTRPSGEPNVQREAAPIPPPVRVRPSEVKIPHNPNLSMAAKKERCRNCVIYNEHQRLKYQALAPLVVAGVPALAYVNIGWIISTLHQLLHTVDELMARFSFAANPQDTGFAVSITSTSVVAEYLIIGCIVVILTTAALRWLEYFIFQLKI
ncbi:MAG: hypothetical protein ACP5VE_08920 [Chthonomonadales bacterium]